MNDNPQPKTGMNEREKRLVGILMAAEAFLQARYDEDQKRALSAAKVFGTKIDQYLGREAPTNGGQNGK